jgi:arylsulfatase A
MRLIQPQTGLHFRGPSAHGKCGRGQPHSRTQAPSSARRLPEGFGVRLSSAAFVTHPPGNEQGWESVYKLRRNLWPRSTVFNLKNVHRALMKIPTACALAVLTAGAFLNIVSAAEVAAPATPNIVFILADDLGWGSLGCYGARADLVRTPNCDRLAREGLRFTDANTPDSVCSPTRYAVMTGRYCWRTSLRHGVLPAQAPLHIETNRLTLASLLQRRGYRTAAIGKWHLGYGTDRRADFTAELRPGPLEIGFDYHFGVPCNHGDVSGVFVENHRVFGLRSTNVVPAGTNYYGGKPFLGIDAPQRKDQEVMSTLTSKAVGWIEQQQAGKPFFLYFTPVTVHEPVTPSSRTKGSSKAGLYGDWIQELDWSVGQVLEALQRKGLVTNTLVILTSDNGGENKKTRSGEQIVAQQAGLLMNGHWRAGKHSIYEGGFRVPFIARWPGYVPAGAVCGQTINLVDTLATTAALLGEKLPSAAQAAEDSCSMLPALLGQARGKALRADMIVHSADGVFAVRQGPWKWIEGKPSMPKPLPSRAVEYKPQLYNLAEDPGEQTNLAESNPEVVQRLAKLLAHYREQGYSRN